MITVSVRLHSESRQIEHVAAQLFVSRLGHPPVDEMIAAPLQALDDELFAVAAAVILTAAPASPRIRPAPGADSDSSHSSSASKMFRSIATRPGSYPPWPSRTVTWSLAPPGVLSIRTQTG